MPRYALLLEYHGAPFCGWQRQRGQPSVQAGLEAALAQLEPGAPPVAAAGRTDSGVHASGQVAHCDLAREWEPFRLMEALNHHLRPAPVAVLAAAAVADDFHARFSARERCYLFRIVIRRAPLALESGLAWQRRHALDVAAMRAAAAHLVGKHDFTTFRAAHCQADSPLRTLDAIEIAEHPLPAGCELRLQFRARSFLHNQVRSITGTLERVGAGAWTPGDVAAALTARDRAACGPVCPPHGLYLTGVRYPADPFTS